MIYDIVNSDTISPIKSYIKNYPLYKIYDSALFLENPKSYILYQKLFP